MTVALEKFKKESEHKKNRIKKLEKSIRDNELTLVTKEEDYKKAVANDDNNIDDLFHEIDDLQRKIRADKHKLSTLRTVTKEHLKKSAINVLTGFETDVNGTYRTKIEKLNEQIKQAKEKYIDEAIKIKKEVMKVNDERNALMREYGNIMKSNGLDRKDINHISSNLYMKLDDATHGVYSGKSTINYEITSKEVSE